MSVRVMKEEGRVLVDKDLIGDYVLSMVFCG
jgi:hypothetical protein